VIDSKKYVASYFLPLALATICAVGTAEDASAQTLPLPSGVEKVCTIEFDEDTRRPARVDDSALPCPKTATKQLKRWSDVKLVLVGVKDPGKDHEAAHNGRMRKKEDTTGLDVRPEDLAAHRSLNTKWYLTTYYGIDPERILPTTDETIFSQEVAFYLVPADADFNHNCLETTKQMSVPAR
jgi:hypothetical protein